VQEKSKTKAVFVNVNNMSEKYFGISKEELPFQKCNVIFDRKQNIILLVLMKDVKSIKTIQIDTKL